MARFELPVLDSELEKDVRFLSESLMSKGLSPICRNCFDEGDSRSYGELVSHFRNVDTPGLESHCFFSDDEVKLISYLGKFSKELHVLLLLDREFFFGKILEKSPRLKDLILSDKGSWGLIETCHLASGSQWYLFQNQEIHIHQSLPGSTNSHLWLANCMAGWTQQNVFVRPDPLRIRPSGSSQLVMERAATYGRPFNREWLKELRRVEIAEHVPNYTSRLGEGVRTQFIWEPLTEGKLQFAIEELPEDQEFVGRVCTRFVHGIYDWSDEVFEHLDGAIHIYDSLDFEKRKTLNLKSHFKKYAKAKIFGSSRLMVGNTASK